MIEREKENEQKVTPPTRSRPPTAAAATAAAARVCMLATTLSPPRRLPFLPSNPHPHQVRGKDKQLGNLLPSIAPHIVAR